MAESEAKRRRWRVGELAAEAGVTVRTLKHYEQSGLMRPGGRTRGGHRLYDEADVERLYRIRACRAVGLSLAEIQVVLKDPGELAAVLRAHLAQVEVELARLGQLRDRLRVLTDGEPARPDALLETMHAMSVVERHVEPDSRAGAELWGPLAEALREHMDRGRPVDDPRVRAIATRARARIREVAGGDARVEAALARLRASGGAGPLVGWDADLMRYLDQALAALAE